MDSAEESFSLPQQAGLLMQVPLQKPLVKNTKANTTIAPVLEIGAVLASRGHDVQFATCAGQEDWAANYPFIKTVYTVGPAASEDDLDVHYETMRLWRHEHGFGPMMRSKYFFDNFWTDTYKSLRSLCEIARPDRGTTCASSRRGNVTSLPS